MRIRQTDKQMAIDLSQPAPEAVIIVGVHTPDRQSYTTNEYLDELEFLVQTAGGVCAQRFIQQLPAPDSRTYIGSGKVLEVKAAVAEHEAGLVVFDDELSPTQQRNLEKELECKVVDRTNLILDIFAQRARTAYAKKQVELAQYQYLLPRLAGLWTHLERQRGGIGMRGPGEREIETDRRIVRDRISKLKGELAQIDRQMATQRQTRGQLVRVALVGYTNVGKSTIMNLLGKADVLAENKLFATLDTTVRRVSTEGGLPYLLSDTVGFIRKLPTQLIESFKSTLDEVREADLLMHVVDLSHPRFEEQIATVNETLRDLKVSEKPQLLVFNKIDAYRPAEREEYDLTPRAPETFTLPELQATWMNRDGANTVFISARTGENLEGLKAELACLVKGIQLERYPWSTGGWE